ncbi:hypothetical protein J5Y09_02440 [Roseomonas sp. PWR1]|uniref:Sel1 repeat family protein n=1 Tax=Roseomonas nitratireducens TaxID=2820810 RepID=A0ABS4AN19_9PROT|nr:hypothetical protein [Neoroseomonas nitratireducens]MBP0462759.1 hypothetical protein [Neoroseomonas nitratireducens]
MTEVLAAADPAHPEGGHAVLLLRGVAELPADPRFRILREGWTKGTLGPEGWQVGDALLSPDRVETSPQGVRLYLGPHVVDWLEAGPVQFRLPAARIEAPVFWPDIAPLHGGSGNAIAGPPPAPRAAPPPPPPPPPPLPGMDTDATVMMAPRAAPPPPPLSVPQPAAPAKGGSALPWILLLLLLVVGAGGGGAYWWFVLRDQAPVVAEAPPPPPATPTAPPVAPPAPEPPRAPEAPLPPVRPQPVPAAPASLDSLSVPEVIARAPSPTAIAAEAARRFEAGRHDDALLLWEAAARAGHAASITRLAGLYDPVGFQPGRPFRDPDPRQAARHYRDAIAAGDAAAAEPRARLRRWLEDRAREGDINAPLTLRDFWQ